MKKAVLLSLSFILILSGCVTQSIMARDGIISQISTVQKDFKIMGRIYVTSHAIMDANGFIIEGSIVTVEMLLKEAEKLGADDIMNLYMDTQIKNETVETVLSGGEKQTRAGRRATYTATALAIKYL